MRSEHLYSLCVVISRTASRLSTMLHHLIVSVFFMAAAAVAPLPPPASGCTIRRSSPYCFFARELPTKMSYCYVRDCTHQRFLPNIGNGYVGTIVGGDEVHVAGLYNGKANVKPRSGWPVFYYQHTHRARIPSTLALNYTMPQNVKGRRSYALDAYSGAYYQWFDGDGVAVEQKLYAHRRFKNLAVTEIQVNASRDVTIKLTSNRGDASRDIDFVDATSRRGAKYEAMVGKTFEAETTEAGRTKVAVVWSYVPDEITVRAGDIRTFRFLSVFVTSLESDDCLKAATKMWDEYDGHTNLFETHAHDWKSLWSSASISVTGSLSLSQTITGSIYYLLTSIRPDWQYGLSPGGLPGGEEYLGHVFWDQDIWMYPGLLALHPEIARTALEYRHKRIGSAQLIASSRGYKGSMFPWESALTGLEVCPGEVYGKNQNHNTGDIAFAVKQYWMATADLKWMKKFGYDLVYNAAMFFASRVKYDQQRDMYVINDVMPPDEYQYPVDNSLYTNVVAKITLEFALKMAVILDRPVPKKWSVIAKKIFIPFDFELKYHPEFEGFNATAEGAHVKQADVILAGFPLMYKMSSTVRANDLKLYAAITNPNGPAMTHSMFCIGWLEVGNEKEATKAFQANFLNVQEPFKVWSEVTHGRGASNFITAAGGFLQSVIFGYGGLRWHEDGLLFNVKSLPETTSFSMRGVKYMGGALNFERASDNVVSVCLRDSGNTKFYISHDGAIETMLEGKKLVIPSGKGKIYVNNSKI